MSTFPVALDSLPTINPTDDEALVSHSGRHTLEGDAINALQTKVGIDGSADTASHDFKIAAAEAAISGKADLDSPALTGVPTAPTAAVGTNTTQHATTAFVQAALDAQLGLAWAIANNRSPV